MRPLIGGIIGLMVISALFPARGETLEGRVTKIHDGDTFHLGGIKVRLAEADAPELAQRCYWANGFWQDCGKVARDRLKEFLADKIVVCEIKGKSYDRGVAYCVVDGIYISRWLVQQGLAWADPRFASPEMIQAQRDAIIRRVGLWGNGFADPREGFQNPCRFRAEKRKGDTKVCSK